MYQQTFGTKQQISFNSEAEYYELLGYLSKNDATTKLVWEKMMNKVLGHRKGE